MQTQTIRERISAADVPEDIRRKIEGFQNNNQTISLRKGQKVNFNLLKSNLNKIVIGFGWDIKNDDDDFYLDAVAFLLQGNGKVYVDEDFIFFNNLKHKSCSVEHLGDTVIDGPDMEQIKINLDKFPYYAEKIDFAIAIYDAETRRRNFGQVSNVYIRVVDEVTGQELIRYDLNEYFSVETAVVLGELFRYNGSWNFYAIGSGFVGGLTALCRNYGVNV